jgi:hypothetical protein
VPIRSRPSGPNRVRQPEWRPELTGIPVTMSVRSVRAVNAAFIRQRTTRMSGVPPAFDRKQV